MMLYEDHLHFIVRPLRLTLFEQTNYMPSLVRYMQNEVRTAPQMVREYKIGNTTYVVKSHSKPDATEDAVSKVKRLIRNDLRKNTANK